MGAFCCCPFVEEFDDYAHPSNFVYRHCMCLRYFFHQLFTGIDSLFQRLDDGHDAISSVHEQTPMASLEPDTSGSNMTSRTFQLAPRPAPFNTDPQYSRLQHEGLVLRHEKSLNHLQEKVQGLRKNGSSSGSNHLGFGRKRIVADSEEACEATHFGIDKTVTLKSSYAMNYAFDASEEEDVCPTCLEEYTEENPKIITQCSHHFHLGCIYEWMERSDNCPICGKEMEFCGSP